MDREQLKKHWEVIQAFKEGKSIQYSTIKGSWNDTNSPNFDISTNYRIKPSPEYVPFDFNDAEKLIGKIITTASKAEFHLITSVEPTGVRFNKGHYHFIVLLDDYQFLDGSPCGKLKE